jgi:hypothetical protein
MPVRLPIATELPAHTYTVALDGVQYQVRLVWRERRASWYLDLLDADGNALVRGRRLSPLWSPVSGMISNGPPGILFATGLDPYDRHEIELWYLTAAERAARPAPEADDGIVVEVE